jgi:hypothetical protein
MKLFTRISPIVAMAIVVVLSLSGCGGNEDINAPDYKSFDSHIYGDWVYAPETDEGGLPFVSGIRILDTRELRSLGVETETGTLRELANGETWRITGAFLGKLQLERNSNVNPHWVLTHELSYRCTETELIFDEWFGLGERVFVRSSVGARVTDPMVSEFEVDLDDGYRNVETWTNRPVSTSPSAFGFVKNGPNDERALVIRANTNGASVEILIDGGGAPGTYAIDNRVRWFVYFMGGREVELRTDPTGNAGTITIDVYDPASGRCSGTFNAVATSLFSYENPVNLTNGRFDVPIYNSPY